MQNVFKRLSATLSLTPLLLLTAIACSDSPTGGSTAWQDGAPRFDIRDAASEDGTPGFYFLAPIAPALANYPGVFDAGRDPVVEICEWSGSHCVGEPVARFTRTEGTAGRRITVDAVAGAYRVDWLSSGVVAGKSYRIHVLDGISELGHADARRPAPGESPMSLRAQGIVAIGNGASFPIRFRIEQNGAPAISITSPEDNSNVKAGVPLTLAGSAVDADEGDISNRIVWRSSRSVDPLGVGASIMVALSSGRHTISASVTDAMGATATSSITVVAGIISAPDTINVPFAGSASIPVTLSEPAPAGGLELAVTSSAPGTASASQAVVSIPAGARSANATINGIAPGRATITIGHPDYGISSTEVTVNARINIVETTVSFAQGRTGQITVELQSGGQVVAAPAGGIAVELEAMNPGCAIASPVTIPAGLVSTTASIAYGGTASTPCSTDITANATNVAEVESDWVTAKVGAAPSITIGSARVGSGLQTSVNITLGAAAPIGGLEVTVVSSDANLLGLSNAAPVAGSGSATVTIPAGTISGTVQLHGASDRVGTTTVTATAPGYATSTIAQTVASIAVETVSLLTSTTTLSADNAFQVRVGVLDATATTFAAYQNVRVGAGPLDVTVANSDASVGQLARTGVRAQSVTVQIAEGANSSPSTVAAGGVAFDPLGAGSTVVSASAPGARPIAASSRTVTVSAPALTMSSSRVGSGLQVGVNIVLGAAAPADLALTVTSSDPGVLLISPSASIVGEGSQTITVPTGESSRTVYLQGVKGNTGTARVTVSAPGYNSATATQVVAPVAVELVSLPASTTTLSADIAFQARVGVLDVAGTGFAAYQNVQPGAGPLGVTVTNSDASVARLVRTGVTAQTTTVQIAEGANASPSTVALGGVAFDPTGAGSTVVSLSAPGTSPVASSSRTVTVSAPAISIGSTRVGSGLQTSLTISLGTAAPAGGVQLAVTSLDPDVLRISNATGVVGSATTTLNVAAGQSSASLQLHGVAGQTGNATLTASAPAYNNGSAVQTVGRTALELVSLPSTTTTLSQNSAFTVRIGVLNVAGTAFAAYQKVQAGAGPLTVNLTNSNASVARLVRTGVDGQTATVQIAEGSEISPSTVPAGGVAFDPLGSGTTIVAASVQAEPGITGTSKTVTVSAPGLSMTSVRVGAGLQGSVQVTLGAPAPDGGIELTIVSSAPDVVRLSPAATVSGTGTVTLEVAAGTTSATLYVHGVIGQSGTATVTASAPGFTNASAAQTVGQTALEFVGLPKSTSAAASNSAFYVRIGVLNTAGTGFDAYQNVQAGAGLLAVIITNSNSSVAQLVSTAGAGQSATVHIAEGSGNSPSTVATGGSSFDPLAIGTTTVTATALAQPSINAVSQTVTVK